MISGIFKYKGKIYTFDTLAEFRITCEQLHISPTYRKKIMTRPVLNKNGKQLFNYNFRSNNFPLELM